MQHRLREKHFLAEHGFPVTPFCEINAEADLRGARNLAQAKPPLHDLVCFHCQQCAEKYLKALLEELGIAGRKMSPAEFTAFVQNQVNEWTGPVKASGAKLN